MISYYNVRHHITMLYDHITISRHEIVRSHHQMKAQEHQASFQVTPRQPQVTASHPKANIRFRVRNRHIKSARKYIIVRRNRPSWKITGNPSVKSCVCSPGTLSTKGFFKNPLRKFVLFLRFYRKSEKLEFRSSGTSSVRDRPVGPSRFGGRRQ